MPLKRKIRNLPEIFEPTLSLADGNPRPTFGPEPIENEDPLVSTTKISLRIKQIQNSIEQARSMLESMDKFKHLMVDNHSCACFIVFFFTFQPSADEQRQKLETIISNLEEQKASYTNLFDLITTTEEERLTLMNSHSANDVRCQKQTL